MVQIKAYTKEEIDILDSLIDKAVSKAFSKVIQINAIQEPRPKEFIKGIHQLAAFLKVSVPKAQQMKNRNVFTFFQDGRLVLFDPDTVRVEMAAYNKTKNNL